MLLLECVSASSSNVTRLHTRSSYRGAGDSNLAPPHSPGDALPIEPSNHWWICTPSYLSRVRCMLTDPPHEALPRTCLPDLHNQGSGLSNALGGLERLGGGGRRRRWLMRYHSHCVGIPDHATRVTPGHFPRVAKRLALADGYLPFLAKPHRLASPPTSTLPAPFPTDTGKGAPLSCLALLALTMTCAGDLSHVTQPTSAQTIYHRCRLQQPQWSCLAPPIARPIGRVIGRDLLPCPISRLACATQYNSRLNGSSLMVCTVPSARGQSGLTSAM